jgi:hypothetical protein
MQAAGGGKHHEINRIRTGLGCGEELAVVGERTRIGEGTGVVLGCFDQQLLGLLQPLRLGVAEGNKLSAFVVGSDGLDVVPADSPAAN